jgi:hypothetical protein
MINPLAMVAIAVFALAVAVAQSLMIGWPQRLLGL